MTIIAILLAFWASQTSGPVYEDDPLVAAMGAVAELALKEATGCAADEWLFNANAESGVRIVAYSAACEQAAEFYRAPDGIRWTFSIEGA